MTYQVTFRKRFDRDGEGADKPNTFIDVADGVVEDAVFSEAFEPDALHVQETMDEDDDFESLGTEIWEYQIRDGREQEFITALENSRMVLEYEQIDDIV